MPYDVRKDPLLSPNTCVLVRNRRESLARDLYRVWSGAASDATPWERLELRKIQAWVDLAEYAKELLVPPERLK